MRDKYESDINGQFSYNTGLTKSLARGTKEMSILSVLAHLFWQTFSFPH